MSNPLQQENKRLQQELLQLKEEASHNEFLLRQSQNRQYELLTAESIPTLLRSLLHGLRDNYKLQAATLVYEDADNAMPDLLLRHHTTLEDYPAFLITENLDSVSKVYSKLRSPLLDEYKHEYKPFFFAERAGINSVALLPLIRHGKMIGSLNFGSSDVSRFTPDLATDILEQLALIVSFCLENVINRERLVLTGLTDALTGWPNRRYLEHRF